MGQHMRNKWRLAFFSSNQPKLLPQLYYLQRLPYSFVKETTRSETNYQSFFYISWNVWKQILVLYVQVCSLWMYIYVINTYSSVAVVYYNYITYGHVTYLSYFCDCIFLYECCEGISRVNTLRASHHALHSCVPLVLACPLASSLSRVLLSSSRSLTY